MAKSRQLSTACVLVLVAAVAASPALAARRNVRRHTANNVHSVPRQVHRQWQMAMNLPPAALLKQDAALPPAAPGHMWVQVPITEVPPHPDAPATDSPTTVATEDASAAQSSTESAVAPSDPEMLKNCKEPRGQFPHPSECGKFYNCWDDFVVEQSCPKELVFSDQGPFCDYPENVDCSTRGGEPAASTEAPANTGSGESVAETTEKPSAPAEGGSGEEEGGNKVSEEQMKEDVGEGCKESYSRYRSPKNCNIFIVCDNSVPYRFECPETLNYNENLGVCDYPYRVDCGNSTSLYPTEAPATDGAQQGAAEVPSEQAQQEVWRNLYYHTLPANNYYYGGFSQLPPVKVVPGYIRRG